MCSDNAETLQKQTHWWTAAGLPEPVLKKQESKYLHKRQKLNISDHKVMGELPFARFMVLSKKTN